MEIFSYKRPEKNTSENKRINRIKYLLISDSPHLDINSRMHSTVKLFIVEPIVNIFNLRPRPHYAG